MNVNCPHCNHLTDVGNSMPLAALVICNKCEKGYSVKADSFDDEVIVKPWGEDKIKYTLTKMPKEHVRYVESEPDYDVNCHQCGEIIYGNHYQLQVLENGKWKPLPHYYCPQCYTHRAETF